MENFKTVALTLLGETAHFCFCSPKMTLLRGIGGVPEIFFPLESYHFCELGAHAKILNPTTPSYAILATVVRRRTRKEKYQK